MKKKCAIFVMTLMFLVFIVSVSNASIIPGTYSNNALGVTDYDGTLIIKSNLGGEFGLGDISSGSSIGSYWSFEGNKRIETYQQNFIDNGDGTATIENGVTRSGGIMTLFGDFLFGDPSGTTYELPMEKKTEIVTINLISNGSGGWMGETFFLDSYWEKYFEFNGVNYRFLSSTHYSADYADIYTVGDYRYFPVSMTNVEHTIEEVPVPEPATLLLLGFGLLGVAGVSRRKN